MVLSISTGLYYKIDYKKVIEVLSNSGFKTIELFLNQAFENVSISDIDKEIKKRNLKVASIHTPLEFIAFPRKESEEYWIEQSLEMAKILNARLINTHMVMGEYFEKSEQGLDQMHKKNLFKYCNKGDIVITTENLPSYSQNALLGNMDTFISFITDNNIPITFDVTHCAASGLAIIDTFDRLKGCVKNIHLSNYGNGNEHKLLEDGDIDIVKFMEYLHKIDYRGLLTLEFDFENPNRNKIIDLNDAENKLRETYQFISKFI